MMTLEIAPNVRVKVERTQVSGFPHTARRRRSRTYKDVASEASGVRLIDSQRGCARSRNFQWNQQAKISLPILMLLALIVAFLYLHFTDGSGLTPASTCGRLDSASR